jgi:uncharacterized protein (UPF0332 family)
MTVKKKTTTLMKEAKPRDQPARPVDAPPESTTELATASGFHVSPIVLDQNTPADYLSRLRQFRALSFCAGIALLGDFFIFALARPYGLPFSQMVLGFAALIELAGGIRLLKTRHDQRKASVLRQVGSIEISPERVVGDQRRLDQHRLMPLCSEYTRDGSAQPRKETRNKRIVKVVNKSRQMLSGAGKLEKDELYSEAILSLERAARSALTAVLLSKGVETQGKEIEVWLPYLGRILQNMSLEDIAYLKALRDRINKGYDATRVEAQRARGVAEPLIADAFECLGASLTKGKGRGGSISNFSPS